MQPEELAKKLELAELKRTLIQRTVLLLEAAGKEEAPVKRGLLRRSITSRATRERGVIGTNLTYAAVVHEGSVAHIIRPRTRKALMWKGAAHPMRSVLHPGTRANPFFDRAITANRDKIDRMAGEAGEQFFSKVAS
jgi:hypothetical protein